MGSISGVSETFVAPAVSFRRLLEGVTLEGGGTPLERNVTIDARAESRPFREDEPADAWRSVPVQVTVKFAGYRTLEYSFRLDEPAEPRVMAIEEE